MTKEIQLTQGQVAIVDDWWFDRLNIYKWRALRDVRTKSYYAIRSTKGLLGKQITIRMHAVIAGTPKGMETDHIDRNTLNNTEENLRVCTNSQNQMNSGKRNNNTSGYKGVTKSGKNWKAEIKLKGKRCYLGSFPTPKEAASAYDEAARLLHGNFANLNFPWKNSV